MVFEGSQTPKDRIDFRYYKQGKGRDMWCLEPLGHGIFVSGDRSHTVLFSGDGDDTMDRWQRGRRMADYLDGLNLLKMPQGTGVHYFNCYSGAAACAHAMGLSNQIQGLELRF
ncbi:MAG: hypothetical protein ACRBCT_04140 [Alphaproteobacteria bacterium]